MSVGRISDAMSLEEACAAVSDEWVSDRDVVELVRTFSPCQDIWDAFASRRNISDDLMFDVLNHSSSLDYLFIANSSLFDRADLTVDQIFTIYQTFDNIADDEISEAVRRVLNADPAPSSEKFLFLCSYHWASSEALFADLLSKAGCVTAESVSKFFEDDFRMEHKYYENYSYGRYDTTSNGALNVATVLALSDRTDKNVVSEMVKADGLAVKVLASTSTHCPDGVRSGTFCDIITNFFNGHIEDRIFKEFVKDMFDCPFFKGEEFVYAINMCKPSHGMRVAFEEMMNVSGSEKFLRFYVSSVSGTADADNIPVEWLRQIFSELVLKNS